LELAFLFVTPGNLLFTIYYLLSSSSPVFFFVFFGGQFCDVAKVEIIHRKISPKFGYKKNMKVIYFLISIFLATLLEPCVEMWQFLLSFFGSNFWLLKISKSTWLFFSAFNFEYTFFWLLYIASLKRAILTVIYLFIYLFIWVGFVMSLKVEMIINRKI